MQTMKTNIRQYSIPALSLFVAFLALFVAIWQGIETRTHNRLSVIPHLDITIVQKELETGKGGIRVINDGVGPAIIKYVKVKWKDKIIIDDNESNYSESQWLHLHETIWPQKNVQAKYIYPRPGAYLQPERRIFSLEVPPEQLTRHDIWCELKYIWLEITYNDVYGNSFKTELNALNHPYFSLCEN